MRLGFISRFYYPCEGFLAKGRSFIDNVFRWEVSSVCRISFFFFLPSLNPNIESLTTILSHASEFIPLILKIKLNKKSQFYY